MRVSIKITNRELHDARDLQLAENHRDLVQQKFMASGFVVVNFMELKYFTKKWGFVVEGETNIALLSK